MKKVFNMKRTLIYSLLFSVSALSVVSSAVAKDMQAVKSAEEQSLKQTFHSPEQAFDSRYYLPTPPVEGDAAFELDKAAYNAGYKLKGTERWQQAAVDANLDTSNVAQIYSVPLGITISEKTTPVLFSMIDKIHMDGGDYATRSAKQYYMRKRPFVYFNHETCQPQDEDALRKNGSYPSGHTTIGWVMALVLSELRPERANELLKRGYEFGQSRIICGAHWKSDVDAGYVVGGAEFSRLQSLKSYQDDMIKARQEIQDQLK